MRINNSIGELEATKFNDYGSINGNAYGNITNDTNFGCGYNYDNDYGNNNNNTNGFTINFKCVHSSIPNNEDRRVLLRSICQVVVLMSRTQIIPGIKQYLQFTIIFECIRFDIQNNRNRRVMFKLVCQILLLMSQMYYQVQNNNNNTNSYEEKLELEHIV